MSGSGQGNRSQLISILAIALMTLGGAYVLFFLARGGGLWGTTNNGIFVDPPLTVLELELADGDGRRLLDGGSWWLWVVAPEVCAASCETALKQLRQLHVLLNKDAGRVRRALLTRPQAEPEVLADYPALEHLSGALSQLDKGIYIVDPIGNLVLFYPLSDAGEPVLEDLKQLLKLSQIG